MASQGHERLIASLGGSIVAESATVPIDTVKVRLQVQNTAAGPKAYKGMLDAFASIAKSEGASGLFKGFGPALLRQCSYTPLTMVLFEPIRGLLVAEGEKPSYFKQLLAAGTAGSVAIAICNPAEVLKTQLQASATERLTMRGVASGVYQTEGVLGFWAGVKPNIARTFLVNAAELGTYAQAKITLVDEGICQEGTLTHHVAASGIAGTVSTLTSTPADVIKTRLMNQAGHAHEYKGMLDAAVNIPRQEGITSLYKGVVPILTRKLVWCTLFFVSYERVLQLVQTK